MAAVSKTGFARSLKDRLNALGCPHTEGAEDTWIVELVFKPGEPRIRLLQWLLSKYDLKLGELVDNPQASAYGSKMDSRIQRLLFVCSNIGLCRYDDVDLIRGIETAAGSSANRQMAFIDQLLDLVLIKDAAEDPMTKSLLSPGIVSDSSSLEDQMSADSRYVDALATLQLCNSMLTPTVDLIPHDIQRQLHNQTRGSGLQDPPSLSKLSDMCVAVEESLRSRLVILGGVQMGADEPQTHIHHVGESLELILNELSQLVLSFSYCYENEMVPWCDKSPPALSQLGAAFKRVHALTEQFAKMLRGLHEIHHSYQHLKEDVKKKLKETSTQDTQSAFLAEASQAAAASFQECVDILESSVQHEHNSILSTSVCSTRLQM